MSEKAVKPTKKKVSVKKPLKSEKEPIKKISKKIIDKVEEQDERLNIDSIIENSVHRELLERNVLERKHLVFLYLFEKSFGNISSTCQAMGIGRSTFYFWKNENELFSEIITEMDDYRLDFVESKLFDNIEAGKEISIIFYLKTKGRNRGYIERIEHDSKHEVVGFEFTDVNAEKKQIGN